MTAHCARLHTIFKGFFVTLLAVQLTACAVNPATGRNQFTGLMSPAQEASVGAQEHRKAIKTFGEYNNADLQRYLNEIGQRLAAHTERPDVRYQFFIVDSANVNAFALPGGYIYVSRGLVALANSESELASVLAHEIAHVTARHAAERYSQSVVTGLGAAVLSAAVNMPEASQALGLGTDLYLKSYSRSQESEADKLALRYLHRAGYNVSSLAQFFESMHKDEILQGTASKSKSYFSTHPATTDRMATTAAQAAGYPPNNGKVNRDGYLRRISGMTYGDSADQGFLRGNTFVHPQLGFALDFPRGYKAANQPSQLVALNRSYGTAIILDVKNSRGAGAMPFLRDVWAEGKPIEGVEPITINGLNAATATMEGRVNGNAATIRLIAIEWAADQMMRLQIAIPPGTPDDVVHDLQRATYSFRRLSPRERDAASATRIRLVTARAGDTAEKLGAEMADAGTGHDGAALFRVLNGLAPGEQPRSGQLYKTVAN